MTIDAEKSMVSQSSPLYVAIGASGPDGLQDIIDLLAAMPAGISAAFLVVLHRPSEQPSQLRSVLQGRTALPVQVAAEAVRLLPGYCYLGAPAEHLTLAAHGRAGMVAGHRDAHRNRTVDLLFESVAEFACGRAVGIVLSGALDDGARGLAAIHRAGGVTMVLRPQTELHGMQQSAIDYNGPVDLIGTSGELADAVLKLISNREFPAK